MPPEAAAQSLADVGNLGGALRLLTQNSPPALYTSDLLSTVLELYPQQGANATDTPVSSEEEERHATSKLHQYPEERLQLHFSNIRQGRGAGPYGDVTDIFRNLALYQPAFGTDTPHLLTVWHYLCIFATNTYPDDIFEEFSAVWQTLLHKEWPQQDAQNPKLRPIGAGSGLRRCITGIIAREEKPYFAEKCLQSNNLGVGVNSGTFLVSISLLAECQKHMFRSKKDLREGNLPSRCLVSLDMKNMFNNMSRIVCRAILFEHFPHLVPLFDSIYKRANKVFIRNLDGSISTILQIEGFAQGCPLSSVLAALVLGELLKKLNRLQKERAQSRNPFPHLSPDSTDNDIAEFLAYIDDANIVLPIVDVKSLLDTISAVGEPYGAYLNKSKTKILTGNINRSILPYLPSHLSATLEQAISTYTSGEETRGVRILGHPIGSKEYVAEYLRTFSTKFVTDTAKLLSTISDPHTCLQIYAKTILQRAPFFLAADVFSSCSTSHQNAYNWQSSLTRIIATTTKRVLKALTGLPQLPHHAYILATLPESLKGLGLFSPERSAITSFIIPMARILRYTTKGIPLHHKKVHTSPYIHSIFKNWQTSSLPIFAKFRNLLSLATSHLTPPPHAVTSNKLRYYAIFHPLNNFHQQLVKQAASSTRNSLLLNPKAFCTLEHHIASLRRHHEDQPLFPQSTTPLAADEHDHNDPDYAFHHWVKHEMHDDLQVSSNSSLHTNTNIALLHAPRNHPEYRLQPKHFHYGLNRFLCLPIFNSHRKCLCGKTISLSGNHLFSCTTLSKKGLHDHIRDAYFVTFRTLGHLTDLVTHKDGVKLEPYNMSTTHPIVRPLDVAMIGDSNTFGINFTIAGAAPLAKQPHHQQKRTLTLHKSKEVEKWRGNEKQYEITEGEGDNAITTKFEGSTIIYDLIEQDVCLLPGSVDAHMRDGPALHWLREGITTKGFDVNHNFGNIDSSSIGALMKQRTTTDPRHCGVFIKANKKWHMQHGMKAFGPTHRDRCPKTWADTFLATQYQLGFARFIDRCLRKLSSNTTSQSLPNRLTTDPRLSPYRQSSYKTQLGTKTYTCIVRDFTTDNIDGDL